MKPTNKSQNPLLEGTIGRYIIVDLEEPDLSYAGIPGAAPPGVCETTKRVPVYAKLVGYDHTFVALENMLTPTIRTSCELKSYLATSFVRDNVSMVKDVLTKALDEHVNEKSEGSLTIDEKKALELYIAQIVIQATTDDSFQFLPNTSHMTGEYQGYGFYPIDKNLMHDFYFPDSFCVAYDKIRSGNPPSDVANILLFYAREIRAFRGRAVDATLDGLRPFLILSRKNETYTPFSLTCRGYLHLMENLQRLPQEFTSMLGMGFINTKDVYRITPIANVIGKMTQ